MCRFVFGLLLTAFAIAGTAGTNGAHAAASVQVKWMNCTLHPGQLDVVYIDNLGDVSQDLTGWELRSDGENERMSLTPAGTIDPGEEIIASAGAHAVNLPDEDVFLWSNNEVLRDGGEPPDYVRLLDPSGNQVSGMDCNHNALAEPTAAPTASPAAEVGAQITTGTGTTPPRTSVSRPAAGSTSPGSLPVGGGSPWGVGSSTSGWLLAGGLVAIAGMGLMFTAARGKQAPVPEPAQRKGSTRRCGD